MKLTAAADDGESGEDAKTTRLSAPRQIASAKDRRRMEVSTVTRGRRPRRHPQHAVHADQDGACGRPQDHPQISRLRSVRRASEDGEPSQAATDISFGAEAKAESDMSIKTIDFPIETAAYDEKSGAFRRRGRRRSFVEPASVLTDGAVQVAALHYVDPQRFGTSDAEQAINAPYGVRIVERTSRSRRAPPPTKTPPPTPKTSFPSPKTATSRTPSPGRL